MAAPPAQPAPAEAVFADPFVSTTSLGAYRLRGLRPEIIRSILRDSPGGEIALEILACPLPAAAGDARVALFVEIDGASFLDSNQARIAPVEVYAYALTPTGAVAGYLAEAFTLDVAQHGEAVWNGGLQFVGWLQLPAGGYELRVMVHNARSLARGLVFAPLSVPVAGASRPTPLPPLFAGPRVRDPWLPIRGRAGWQPPGGPTYPLAVGSRPLLPAARPVLVSGREATAHFFADRLPRDAADGWVELLVQAAAGDGTAKRAVVAKAPLETDTHERGTNGMASVTVRFAAPAVTPGRYDLRLVLDSAAGPIGTPPLTVLMIDAGPQDRELLWSDLKALTAAAELVAEAEVNTAPAAVGPPQAGAGRAVRRLTARYRQTLAASMATRATRPAPVFDFELSVLGRGGKEPFARLRQAELRVAVELGQRQADLLLPLIALHDELFHLYRRRKLFSLVSHTRRLLETLAELHAELGGEPEMTAGVLASVAGYMQELRAPGHSRRLFGRALEHDPDNPPALLGLASSYEKHGEYAQAVDRLELLVAAWPALEEGRLRLALNLERIGERLRFRELLTGLVTGDSTSWVSAVACQELARSLLQAGSLAAAEAVLKEALERMPNRQALWVLLAHVYDRQGLLASSWESLERVAASRTAAPGSERLIYDDWANGPLERAREAFRLESAHARAALRRALEPGEAAEP